MIESKFLIEDCKPEDSKLIAEAILTAIGEEITNNMAGDKGRETVEQIFATLAGQNDTQYSYLNTRIARSKTGEPMGICISYDGEELKRLRRPFFKEANRQLGWGLTTEEIEGLPGETDKNEYYLDTLMTLPKYRGKGVATALIKDAFDKAKKTGKPLGLLCDKTNDKARSLYEKIGFEMKGVRPFAGHDMFHLQLGYF